MTSKWPMKCTEGNCYKPSSSVAVQLLQLSQRHWMFYKRPYVLNCAAIWRNHLRHRLPTTTKHNANNWRAIVLSTASIRASEWPWTGRHYTQVSNSFHSFWPVLNELNLTHYSKVQTAVAQTPSHRWILIVFGVAHRLITVKLVQIFVNIFSW